MFRKFIAASVTLSIFAAASAEAQQDAFPAIERLKPELGKAELIDEPDGHQSIKLYGITPEIKGSKYFSFSIFLKEPINIENNYNAICQTLIFQLVRQL